MWKAIFITVLLGWGGYHWWSNRPVAFSPGVAAVQLPLQQQIGEAQSFTYKGYRVTPLARFNMQARVLARENYHFGREAELSPTDLVLGWGRMSDGAVLSRIDIRQSNRFYYWSVKEFPIPREEIENSSANMHLIPADGVIERGLSRIRQGQLVRLRGYLVRVDASDGWNWVSSLSRGDTGPGACELIWVEELVNL